MTVSCPKTCNFGDGKNPSIKKVSGIMKQTIRQRIEALRSIMKEEGVQAIIIPSTDPHMSEYVAPHWQAREWISGFTGSAGTAVITTDKAGLWTDSRYFLQAADQLEGSGIHLYKEMLPDTPSIPTYLAAEVKPGGTVGIDATVFSTHDAQRLTDTLNGQGIQVKIISDPLTRIWHDRPALPDAPACIYPLQYAGKSCKDKLTDIRQEMQKEGIQTLLVSALDEIAWTLNLRGHDVHCNPVVVSYLVIQEREAHYFIQPQKLTDDVADYLTKECGITLHPYDEINRYLAALPPQVVGLKPEQTNYALYDAIASTKCNIREISSPIAFMKAMRNEREIAGIHAAMQRDGVALVRFLMWLEQAVPQGKETEMSVSRKLQELRAAQPLYMGDSFDTIAGYAEHGAIVHYEATPDTDKPLQPKGFLLLDSGAQYLDGTTDITRTIPLGPLTKEEMLDYTLILKGHIALATAVFPQGTRGTQLDVLARMPLWQHRANYLHGTGHGVGHFLNVHEGPQSIRMNENPVTLQSGMVTSNEPGVYRAGSHGVRIENLLLTVPAGEGMFGSYLRFETLTLCPISTQAICPDMLNEAEIEWLNAYHQLVYQKLSPALDEDERQWLLKATCPIRATCKSIK